MTLSDDMGYERLVLDRIKVAAIQHLPRYVAQETDLTVHADFLGESLGLRLESEVLGKTIGHRTVTRTVHWQEPASWWHAVLERFFPLAAKTVTRSKTIEIDVEYKAVFPDAGVKFPKELGSPSIITFTQGGYR